MRKNKLIVLILAAVILAALPGGMQRVSAARPAYQGAAYQGAAVLDAVQPLDLPSTPENVAVALLDGYPYVTWDIVDNADYYVVTRKRGTNPTQTLGTTYGTFWHDTTLTVNGTYNYRVYAVNDEGTSATSPAAPINWVAPPPTPTPAPPTPTPGPLSTYPPIPEYSLIPLPTPAPALAIYNMAYNYYTYASAYQYSYNRNGTLYNTPPPYINLPLVANTVSLPVHFSFSNSLMNQYGFTSDDFAIISVKVDVGSYTVGDTLNFSYVFDDLRAVFALVSTDPADEVANPNIALTVWDLATNRVFWSPSSVIPFSQFLAGYSDSFVLDYEGIRDLEFEIRITGQRNFELPSGMYLDGDSVRFSLWSSLMSVDDPSVPVVNAINSQTTVVGRFFSWLWRSLADAFIWLGNFILDGFDTIGIRLDQLSANLFDWFASLAISIRDAAASVVQSVSAAASDIISFTGRLFIPSAEDLQNMIARIRETIDPEDGSVLAFPHEFELQLFTILGRDYSVEPDPIVLQEFQMNLAGQNYVVFPRTEISLSTIFPPSVHRYVRTFGDLTLGVWVLHLITNKVRKLLNLWYSED